MMVSEMTFVMAALTINDHAGSNFGISDKGGHGAVVLLVIALNVR